MTLLNAADPLGILLTGIDIAKCQERLFTKFDNLKEAAGLILPFVCCDIKKDFYNACFGTNNLC